MWLISLAHGTSCGPFMLTSPSAGSANVPVNASPYAEVYYGSGALMDADGHVVPTQAVGRRLVPLEPLAPNQTYEVHGAYEEVAFTTGEAVDRVAPDPPVFLGHRWEDVANWVVGEHLQVDVGAHRGHLRLRRGRAPAGRIRGPSRGLRSSRGRRPTVGDRRGAARLRDLARWPHGRVGAWALGVALAIARRRATGPQ